LLSQPQPRTPGPDRYRLSRLLSAWSPIGMDSVNRAGLWVVGWMDDGRAAVPHLLQKMTNESLDTYACLSAGCCWYALLGGIASLTFCRQRKSGMHASVTGGNLRQDGAGQIIPQQVRWRDGGAFIHLQYLDNCTANFHGKSE